MNAYLFTYSSTCLQAQVHAVLNNTNAIETWIAPFPYAAILVSNLTTKELCAILHEHLPETWFVIAQLDRMLVDGWLPGNFWEYVNNPAQASFQELLDQLPASSDNDASPARVGSTVS